MKTKHCLSCGRPFSEQKRWEKNWDEVKYCSQKCRTNKWDKKFKDLAQFILNNGHLNNHEIEENYFQKKNKNSSEIVKSVCRRLHLSGEITILQKGKPISSTNFRGKYDIKINN